MKNNSLTVIIPAYNEEQNVGRVIRQLSKEELIDEIIVVANSCTDKTKEVALKAGANVVVCNKKGKGHAMEAGIKKAKNEILIFLDADIPKYSDNIVKILSYPIIFEDVDFVKSSFIRIKGGTVTELVAKPLLNTLFPDMNKFSEPLSGMIATKKSLLKKVYIEKDYGVDIGILIDMYKMDKNIKEVNIGVIENLSHIGKTSETKKKMSLEVICAILKRANYLEEEELIKNKSNVS